MTYISAVFLFLFLPLSLAVYYLCPESIRKTALLVISAAYYVTAGIKRPLVMLIMFAVAILTYLLGRLFSNTYIHLLYIVYIIFLLTMLLCYRLLYGEFAVFDVYPVGMSVWILSCISFLADVSRGDVRHVRFVDTLLYITYFPCIAMGPAVRYKVFLRALEKKENTFERFADGVRRFIYGFTMFISVSAVLYMAYGDVTDIAGKYSINVVCIIIAAVISAFAAYFAITGLRNISYGMSLMFGITLTEPDNGTVFSLTPYKYFTRLLPDISAWVHDYSIPFNKNVSDRLHMGLSASLTVFLISLWIKSTTFTFAVSIITAMIVFLYYISGMETRLERKSRYAIPAFGLSAVIITLFWFAVTSPSPDRLFSMIAGSTDGRYGSYRVYMSLSGMKYAASLILGILMAVVPTVYKAVSEKISVKMKTLLKYVSDILLILLFAVSILYYMPQFAEYGTKLSKYLIF